MILGEVKVRNLQTTQIGLLDYTHARVHACTHAHTHTQSHTQSHTHRDRERV